MNPAKEETCPETNQTTVTLQSPQARKHWVTGSGFLCRLSASSQRSGSFIKYFPVNSAKEDTWAKLHMFTARKRLAGGSGGSWVTPVFSQRSGSSTSYCPEKHFYPVKNKTRNPKLDSPFIINKRFKLVRVFNAEVAQPEQLNVHFRFPFVARLFKFFAYVFIKPVRDFGVFLTHGLSPCLELVCDISNYRPTRQRGIVAPLPFLFQSSGRLPAFGGHFLHPQCKRPRRHLVQIICNAYQVQADLFGFCASRLPPVVAQLNDVAHSLLRSWFNHDKGGFGNVQKVFGKIQKIVGGAYEARQH